MTKKNTVSALKKCLLPVLIIVGFASWTKAQTGCTIPVGTSHDQLRKILKTEYHPIPHAEFVLIDDTVNARNAVIQKAMLALEKQNCWSDTTLDKAWDKLFNRQTAMYHNVIPRVMVENEESFARELLAHIARMDKENLKRTYKLPSTGLPDTLMRVYELALAPTAYTVYFSANAFSSAQIEFRVIAQYPISNKTLKTAPKPKMTFGTGSGGTGSNPFGKRSTSGSMTLPELNGRKVLYRPETPDGAGNVGILKMNVCVLPDGTVESAEYTMRGSTTQNSTLKDIAQKHAKKLKFSPATATECYLVSFDFK